MVGAVGNNAIRAGEFDIEDFDKFLSGSLIDIRPAVIMSEPAQDCGPVGGAREPGHPRLFHYITFISLPLHLD